jgi:hypothetical protein
MALDSDIHNADSHLHVEFYTNDQKPYKDRPTPFVRIIVPGDKTNIVDQPVREDHKERFPRQWLHFQMQSGDGPVIGTLLQQWNTDDEENFSLHQMAELQILKFQTVEQVATASDSQLQRIGMGGAGLRERAKTYLTRKNQSANTSELEITRRELDELKQQMAMLMETKKLGRPRKEA